MDPSIPRYVDLKLEPLTSLYLQLMHWLVSLLIISHQVSRRAEAQWTNGAHRTSCPHVISDSDVFPCTSCFELSQVSSVNDWRKTYHEIGGLKLFIAIAVHHSTTQSER